MSDTHPPPPPPQRFVGTRGGARSDLRRAVSGGGAPDGGLYTPDPIPSLDWSSLPKGEKDLMACVLGSLFPDPDAETIDGIVSGLAFPVPLVEVEAGVYVLELFHGPTAAFKDFGAIALAHLAAWSAGPDERKTVLVATSGDTGGAVAHAFHDLPGFRVVALFPFDGVSERQRRQMTTLGPDVVAAGVTGSFDDCQQLVRGAFADTELIATHGLISANSINVGRLLPQSLYYILASHRLRGSGPPPRFVVPCGNLGNLCAGLIAGRMGMPHSGFVAATNENRVFVDFVESGRVERRAVVRTASNAMDVAVPNNLERIRWLYGDDAEALRGDVTAVSVAGDAARGCQEDVYSRTGYLLDPHSAVAYEAQRRVRPRRGVPTVVMATAHPAKFPDVSDRVAGTPVPLPATLAATRDSEERMTRIAPSSEALTAVLEARIE